VLEEAAGFFPVAGAPWATESAKSTRIRLALAGGTASLSRQALPDLRQGGERITESLTLSAPSGQAAAD